MAYDRSKSKEARLAASLELRLAHWQLLARLGLGHETQARAERSVKWLTHELYRARRAAALKTEPTHV
jgi:hypothetical protein